MGNMLSAMSMPTEALQENSMLHPEVLEALKQLRKNAGLSQDELAYRAGISQSTVSQIERGVLNPINLQHSRLQAYIRELKLDFHEFEEVTGLPITKLVNKPELDTTKLSFVVKSLDLKVAAGEYGESEVELQVWQLQGSQPSNCEVYKLEANSWLDEGLKLQLPLYCKPLFDKTLSPEENDIVLVELGDQLGIAKYTQDQPFLFVPYQAINGERKFVDNNPENIKGVYLFHISETREEKQLRLARAS